MADNVVLNQIFEKVLTPILTFFNWLIGTIFSSQALALIIAVILINILAVVLMKKDKKYAENGERRISETTLLTVALVGGSLGMYYAMFKYKHKTLHNKFSIGVPVIILLQFTYISYLLVGGILS